MNSLHLRAALALLVLLTPTLSAAKPADRYVQAIAVTANGQETVVGIRNGEGKHMVVAMETASSRVLWSQDFAAIPTRLAFSPGDRMLAIGFGAVFGDDPGVLVVDPVTGDAKEALRSDEKLDFDPGAMYNTWGDGLVGLAFAPDGSLLYGLSNDTMFAWDMGAQRYLWVKDVPGVFVTPKDLPDILPYGHATALAVSPDGKQLVAVRTVLRVTSAGRTRPTHFIARGSKDISMLQPGRAAFSADNRILAAGDAAPLDRQGGLSYALEFWIGSNPKGTRVPGCGGGIAWTNQPNLFGCQDAAGTHLRNIFAPTADVGAAGPASDLPILKVGNSLWSVAYKSGDWKDAANPLPLTLVELGSGKRVTITLPGRTAPAPTSH